MTLTSGLKVSFSAFSSIQECREYVDKNDRDRKGFLTLSNCGAQGRYVLPLVDRWLTEFPGRVFVEPSPQTDSKEDEDDLELMNEDTLIRERLPEARADVCWRGSLVLGDQSTEAMIFNPVKYDRLPRSENLFVLSRVTEEQWSSIPSSTNRAVHCVIRVPVIWPDLTNTVLIAPQENDCSLFLMTEAPRHKASPKLRAGEKEFLLRPIPAPSLFRDIHKAAIADVTRTAPLQQPHYLRALGLGSERFGRTHADTLETIMTRKQLNVLRTVEKIEAKIFPFFETYKRSFSEPPNESNFESGTILKKLRKIGPNASQDPINKIFQTMSQMAGSLEDHVYAGKRFRRLFGTSFNSHKWVHAPTSFQPVDAPLVSEVVGTL